MADNQLSNFIFYSQKYGSSDTSLTPVCPSLTPELQSFIREGGFCTVLDQPIPLDRLILKNVDPIHVTGMCLCAFEHLHKYHLNALCMWQYKGKMIFVHKLPSDAWGALALWLHSFSPTMNCLHRCYIPCPPASNSDFYIHTRYHPFTLKEVVRLQ